MRRARLAVPVLPEITAGLLLFLVAGLFTLLPSPLSGDDGLRHIAMARILWSEGCCPGWDRFLYAGYLAEHSVDPWFLAHVTYLPFAGFSTELALKLYTLVSIGTLFAAFLSLLRSTGVKPVPASFLLALLFLGNSLFLGRALIGRPFVLMTAMVLLELQFVLQRRHIAVAALLLVATLFSHLFILPLLVAITAANWLWSFGERHRAYQLLLLSSLAVVLGVLFHPQPWQYLHYLGVVFLRIPFAKSLPLGMELYSGFHMSVTPVALLGAVLLLLAGKLQRGGRAAFAGFHRQGGTLLMALCVVLLFGFFLWSRVIDLLWPLLLVLFAQALVFSRSEVEELRTCVCAQWGRWTLRGGPLLSLLVLLLCAVTFAFVGKRAVSSDRLRSLEHAAVLKLLPPGAHVLNPEWDFFPSFAAVQPNVRYATGMDPTFLFVQDSDAHEAILLAYNPIVDTPYPLIDGGAWLAELRKRFPSSTHLLLSRRRFGAIIPRIALLPGVRALSAPDGPYGLFALE